MIWIMSPNIISFFVSFFYQYKLRALYIEIVQEKQAFFLMILSKIVLSVKLYSLIRERTTHSGRNICSIKINYQKPCRKVRNINFLHRNYIVPNGTKSCFYIVFYKYFAPNGASSRQKKKILFFI